MHPGGMNLHPTSLVAGAALFASILALSSAAPQTVITGSPGVIQHDIAHPRNFVEIKEGVPYTVPSARLFVVTNLGTFGPATHSRLFVNGSQVIEVDTAYPTVKTIGRYVCLPGDVVELLDGTSADHARAWGFLTDI